MTPLRPEAWKGWLAAAGLETKYPTVVAGLEKGFSIGIPQITRTNIPNNSLSLLDHTSTFRDMVRKEFDLGRYIGPFSQAELESLIGPFQTSPLSIIPKPHKPSAFRLIQNFSYPHTPSNSHQSINSHLNSDNFPCTWGTFTAFALMVARLPPGAEACVRDVAEAYRVVPLHPSQWPGTVVRLDGADSFAVDTQASFGCAPNAGQFGQIMDGGTDIMRYAGLGPIAKWVDDTVFIRIPKKHLAAYNEKRAEWRARAIEQGGQHHTGGRLWYGGTELPDGRIEEFDEDLAFDIRDLSGRTPRTDRDARFSCALEDIDWICGELGIPWQLEKDTPWSSTFVFTGLEWSLREKTVALTDAKREKYRRALEQWRTDDPKRGNRKSLEEVQKLYGKLLHATLVIPEGRAYLTGFEKALSQYGENHWALRHPPKACAHEALWWSATLSSPPPPRPVPGPVTVLDLRAYSDASNLGIAITIGDAWDAWTLRPGWDSQGRNIAWAEAIAFELLTRALVAHPRRAPHLRIYGDNVGVVEGWWNGRSRAALVNDIFRRVHSFSKQHNTQFYTRYVASAANPADGPSRGLFPPGPRLPPTTIPPEMAGFIDSVPRHGDTAATSPTGYTLGPARPQRANAKLQRQHTARHAQREHSYLARSA